MKKISCTIVYVLLLVSLSNGQSISGRMVDQTGGGLADLQLQLFIGVDIYSTDSNSEGYFQFNNITGVHENHLPVGYSVSENYPNPFNPTTRFNISVPQPSKVKISVYNVTGQEVRDTFEKTLGSGNSHIDLELNGLPNGFYITRFIINDQYTVIKKLMLLYGSEHLSGSESSFTSILPKTLSTILDSIVVTNLNIGNITFADLPDMESNNLDLGDLVIDLSSLFECPDSVFYANKTYNAVKIGDQCWLRENLDVGTMVHGLSGMPDNGIIEKYCYDNDPINCDIYGGLYLWNEAMHHSTEEGSQGICPNGWHIPTYEEMQILRESVGRDGPSLKAVGQGSGNGAGTNTSGFSALLSGYRFYDGSFYYLSDNAYFLSSHEFNASMSLNMYLNSYGVDAYFNQFSKDNAYSIRCLKDVGTIINNYSPDEPDNPSPADSSVSVETSINLTWTCNDPDGDNLTYDIYFGTSNNPPLVDNNQSETIYSLESLEKATTYYWKIIAHDGKGGETQGTVWSFTTESGIILTGESCPGIPTVTYGGKTYNTVQIGEQCWFKENLDIGTMIINEDSSDYQTDNGIIEKYCYDNDTLYCKIYGGLYQWHEAMQYVTTEGTQGICPDGWHIPTYSDFRYLAFAVNFSSNALKEIGQGGYPGDGTNTSGFSALLGGIRSWNGDFGYTDGITIIQGSTIRISGVPTIYDLEIIYNDNSFNIAHRRSINGVSVRCLKD